MSQDNRTQPLVHLATNVIPNLRSLKYVLVENVRCIYNPSCQSSLILNHPIIFNLVDIWC